MNRLITPEKFARDVWKLMRKSERKAGLRRGELLREMVRAFNKRWWPE